MEPGTLTCLWTSLTGRLDHHHFPHLSLCTFKSRRLAVLKRLWRSSPDTMRHKNCCLCVVLENTLQTAYDPPSEFHTARARCYGSGNDAKSHRTSYGIVRELTLKPLHLALTVRGTLVSNDMQVLAITSQAVESTLPTRYYRAPADSTGRSRMAMPRKEGTACVANILTYAIDASFCQQDSHLTSSSTTK